MTAIENQNNTSPSWWTLAQMLVWILQQVEMSPQDAEQFCHSLNPKIIEGALNVLTRVLFNTICGAVDEGMPIVAARTLYGVDLATFFRSLPSLEPGALDALRYEIRRLIEQPGVKFNPVWGKRIRLAPAPTPTRPTESVVADEAEPIPGSKIGPEASQPSDKPDSVDASMPATQAAPAHIINVGDVDPDITHAIKQVKPARWANLLADVLAAVKNAGAEAEPDKSSVARAGGLMAADPAASASTQSASEAQSEKPDESMVTDTAAAASEPAVARKRGKRRGPEPGAIDRFGEADRKLFSEMTAFITTENLTPREAARRLLPKIAGQTRSSEESRIRRLADRYRDEVEH